MRYLWMILLTVGVIFNCSSDKDLPKSTLKTEVTGHEGHNHGATEKLIYYTCPMEAHKHVHSKTPGACPECDMALVQGVITTETEMDYYGCPMLIHSHVRHDAPGRCEECKMALKPMRLKKNV